MLVTLRNLCFNQFSSIWLLDSGVSCHIATHEELFSSLIPLKTPLKAYLPDGSVCYPKLYGTVFVTPHITLENVYLIPKFRVNLLSVSCLVHSSNLALTFLPEKCLF